LEARFYAEMITNLEEVTFDGPAGYSENTADVRGALSVLHPVEALQLPVRDAKWRKTALFRIELPVSSVGGGRSGAAEGC